MVELLISFISMICIKKISITLALRYTKVRGGKESLGYMMNE